MSFHKERAKSLAKPFKQLQGTDFSTEVVIFGSTFLSETAIFSSTLTLIFCIIHTDIHLLRLFFYANTAFLTA